MRFLVRRDTVFLRRHVPDLVDALEQTRLRKPLNGITRPLVRRAESRFCGGRFIQRDPCKMESDEALVILSRCPEIPLARYVECIWHHESISPVQGRDRVLPDGRFHLMLNLETGTSAVAGLRSNYVVVDNAGVKSVMGVVFRPGAARRFFSAPAVQFLDRAIPLHDVWGRAPEARLLDRLREATAGETRLKILERALTKRLNVGERHDAIGPAVQFALRAFSEAPSMQTVTEVSRRLGWSRRWFSHRFAETVGMPPKRYFRLLRFHDLVEQVSAGKPVSWADVALKSGFFDQAHLVHEFRAFSGMSPEQFLAAKRPYPSHVQMA